VPSIEFSNSVRFNTWGTLTIYLRVNYSETYHADGNYTTVSLSSVETKSNTLIGSSEFNGDGISFSANNSSWTNVGSFSNWNQVNIDTSYSSIGGISTGSINVYHNSSGAATLYVKFSCNIVA